MLGWHYRYAKRERMLAVVLKRVHSLPEKTRGGCEFAV